MGVSTSGILFLGLAWRGDSWVGCLDTVVGVGVLMWLLCSLVSCIGGFGFGWVFGGLIA